MNIHLEPQVLVILVLRETSSDLESLVHGHILELLSLAFAGRFSH